MSGPAGLLELSTGSVLRLDGTDWTVAVIDACFGRVRLESGGGDERWRSIRWLAHHRDCQSVPAVAEEGPVGLRRQPHGRRNATTHTQRWSPENVPAFLPQDWHDRYFTPIPGVSDRFIRRTAALRLVQMVAGGSLGEAAGFLGIASTDTTWLGKSGIYTGVGHVHTGARQQPDPRSFESALTALARELDDPATPLVNYQHRRQALQDWCIDEGTWAELVGQLPRVPGPQPEAGNRKRQIASIYVWTLVTSGEHHFAPRPIEATQPPEVQEAWSLRRNTIWSLMHRNRPGPHYASLMSELSGLATSLAKAIDAPG